VAFVLGGGGVLGAVEVGMVRALTERGIVPDIVVGTSVGALNGVLVAADPSEGVVERLIELWASPQARDVFGDSTPKQLARLARAGTHLHSPEPLRRMLIRELNGATTFDKLPVRFECCAASIERAAEVWFVDGPLIDAVLASAAIPGLLPPVVIDDEHYVDGGIVNSIPVGRAIELGAKTIYVLQVGRIDRPLTPPRNPVEVARVAFEISRRHRFAREMAAAPKSVKVHVLPAGEGSRRDDSPLAYRDLAATTRRIERAYEMSAAYLENTL
jgi:NTE family protein